VRTERVPHEFHGVTFVVLADLHNNSFGKDNDILIYKIIEINPDFIIIAGDMIVGKKNNNYEIAYSVLSKLASKYPIYYGFGNHEQKVMAEGKHYDQQFYDYLQELKKIGIIILDNNSITISKKNEKIAITGLLLGPEYFKKFRHNKIERNYLQNLVGIPSNQCYNILIAHNPVYFKNYLDWGADLIVSGHLHGGIVRLPKVGGMISPQYKIFPPYDAGRFDEKGKTMLVSRGLGTHTIKIRVCNPPDLMTVTLEKTNI
jgi:predicted MPP superfamily phosphohydrolase